MRAFITCQTTLTGKMDSLQTDIRLLCKSMVKFWAHLTAMEHCVGNSEDTIRDQATTIQAKVNLLMSRAEDAEIHNRHNNLEIPGNAGGSRESRILWLLLSICCNPCSLRCNSSYSLLLNEPRGCWQISSLRMPHHATLSFGCLISKTMI